MNANVGRSASWRSTILVILVLLCCAGLGLFYYSCFSKRAIIATLKGHSEVVLCIAFSSDGSYVASGGGDGSLILSSMSAPNNSRVLTGHKELIWALAFAPDSRKVASASRDGTVRIWDVLSGRTLRVINSDRGETFAVAFSENGGLVISGGSDKCVKMWDAESGSLVQMLDPEADEIRAIAMSPNGKRLASRIATGAVTVWNLVPTTKQVVIDEVGVGTLQCPLLFGQDDSTIITNGNDHAIHIWDAGTGDKIAQLETGVRFKIFSIAMARSRGIIAIASQDSTRSAREYGVLFMKLSNGRQIMTLRMEKITAVAIGCDDTRLAMGTRNGVVQVFDFYKLMAGAD